MNANNKEMQLLIDASQTYSGDYLLSFFPEDGVVVMQEMDSIVLDMSE